MGAVPERYHILIGKAMACYESGEDMFLLMIQSSLPILIINCFLIPFAHKLSAGSPILFFRVPQSNHGL